MAKRGVIIGNGNCAQPDGRGVEHPFELGDRVLITKEIADDKGKLKRYICKDGHGRERIVMPEHVKLIE